MNKLYKVFTLLVVALVGLSLTGCSEDDLDTNPYSKSGVNIVGFGPSPILRTHEIRITGTNFSKVTGVAFPGNAVVERAAFNSSDAQNIYVNVPDESVPGKIRLVAGSDTLATSTSLLTFEEPIEVTSVTPTTNLNAGDEITIRGEYVYNIAEVVFACGATGAPVIAEDFTYVSRKEIRVQVPLAAESGKITMNDGADWELEWETPLDIKSATFTALSKTTAEFGEQITITGSNLHTVETVMFPGGVTCDFTVSDDHNTITTTVPAETKSGAITLVLYSGASLTTDELNVPTLNITEVSKEKDLRVGDEIVLTGENLDRIASIVMPGHGEMAAGEYTISGNKLSFIVPEDMTDGSMVLTQNSFISVTLKFIMHTDAPEQTIWAGEFVCAGWNGNQELAWGGFDWSTVAAGSKVSFYYKKNNPGNWGCISLRHGDSWGNLPSPIPGQYDLDEDEGVLGVVFAQEVLDDIVANGGLVLTGDNYTLTKVTIPAPVTEIVLWQGEAVADDWANQPYVLSDAGVELAEAGAKAGQTIYFYLTPTDTDWKLQFVEGHWGPTYESICNIGNPDTEDGKFTEYDLEGNGGRFGLKLTQDILDAALKQQWWGGVFVLNGDNIICTKITLE